MDKKIISVILLLLFPYVFYGQRTTVSGSIKNIPDSYSIKCSFLPNDILSPISAVTIPVIKGQFHYQFDIKKTVFIGFEENKNFYGGFIEPGDSIVILYDANDFKNSIGYFGKGKEKFTLFNTINYLRGSFRQEGIFAKEKAYPVDYFFSKTDSARKAISNQLILAKRFMNNESFAQLNSCLAANILKVNYNEGVLTILGDYTYDDFILKENARLTNTSKLALKNLLHFNENSFNSYFYLNSVYSLLSIHYKNNFLSKNPNSNLLTKYNYLINFLPAKIKSPVLFKFLNAEPQNTNPEEFDLIVNKVFSAQSDFKYKKKLKEKLAFSRALKNGAAAPDFTLENLNGKKVNLSSFKGKVVYLDFWFATCTPCHKLFKETKITKEYFNLDSNVVFLTVSTDTKEVWKNAVQKFKIKGYHTYTENKLRNHPIIRRYNVIEYPTTVLIGKNGNILNTTPSENGDNLKKEIEQALLE